MTPRLTRSDWVKIWLELSIIGWSPMNAMKLEIEQRVDAALRKRGKEKKSK